MNLYLNLLQTISSHKQKCQFSMLYILLLDSSSQTKQQQSLKILQLLVYTAAETDALQFIDMIFSTSAGKIIFNSYKDKTPLPEDIARANGHEDLARYLQDLNIRYMYVHLLCCHCHVCVYVSCLWI